MTAPFGGKWCLVVSAPSYRDTIYVGITTRHGDLLRITQARMVVHYQQSATAGLAGDPGAAVRIRSVNHGDGVVWIPLANVAQIIESDEIKWGLTEDRG